MKAQNPGPVLSTVFVDYDNIYLSLKRKNEEAAKRFAKDSGLWLREIESGRLITSTTGANFAQPRRIVMSRCYGNPVPRRNANDNSTDMSSFPFVRHHFLRAGFEVIDCPPLTQQLKNSADIRMVMDVRDVLNHETYFDEFIILSGDADFTPVLHRLRAHARRTVVFANDHTAAPYTAISDGEIREADLIALLLEGRMGAESETDARPALEGRGPSSAQLEGMRRDIVAEVVGSVRAAARPVPLEALADRAVRALGHEKTVGSAWGGAGSFRDLLSNGLPGDVKLSEQPPYFAYDASRQTAIEREVERVKDASPDRDEAPALSQFMPATEPLAQRGAPLQAASLTSSPMPLSMGPPTAPPPMMSSMPPAAGQRLPAQQPGASFQPTPYTAPPPHASLQDAGLSARPAAPAQAKPRAAGDAATELQKSIARIHEACQAPPLSPPEYRVLFEVMAEEINTNSLAGAQTLINIAQRAQEMGLEVRRDDARFVLEVVSEADPWFDQGASANLFASRFRNFVVARCRSQGLALSQEEIDLIDAWFGGAPASQRGIGPGAFGQAETAQPFSAGADAPGAGLRWPGADDMRAQGGGERSLTRFSAEPEDEFPRIVRSRLRG